MEFLRPKTETASATEMTFDSSNQARSQIEKSKDESELQENAEMIEAAKVLFGSSIQTMPTGEEPKESHTKPSLPLPAYLNSERQIPQQDYYPFGWRADGPPLPNLLRRPTTTDVFQQHNGGQAPMYPLKMDLQRMRPQGNYPVFTMPEYGGEQLYMAFPVGNPNTQATSRENQAVTDSEPKAKRPKKQRRKSSLCSFAGCGKYARGSTALCVRHGGGVRCAAEDCEKGARPRSAFCSLHGGGKRCASNGCKKGALSKSIYCCIHGKLNEHVSMLLQIPKAK